MALKCSCGFEVENEKSDKCDKCLLEKLTGRNGGRRKKNREE